MLLAPFCHCSSLSALNASFNPLGPKFPALLCSMTALAELNLDFTGVRDVPLDLGKLKCLESLQLDGCPLQHPYDELYNADPELLLHAHDSAVDQLDLSQLNLQAVPPCLQLLRQLVYLDLAGNHIADPAPGLSKVTALTELRSGVIRAQRCPRPAFVFVPYSFVRVSRSKIQYIPGNCCW